MQSTLLTAAAALTAGLLVALTATAVPVAAAPTAAAGPAVASTLPGYTPLLPTRICDTRASGPGVAANQCDSLGHTPLSTGGVLAVTVAGVAGVPVGATAVVLHVTATGTNAASFLTVWPTGQAQPTAANLNWTPGQTVPNLVQTGVGTNGLVNVFNLAGSVDVVIDLEGYFMTGTGGLFNPVTANRICDTRLSSPANACNQQGSVAGTLTPGKTRVVNVESGSGIPTGATAAILNVTATATTAASFLTVWPGGSVQPLASSLNWVPGQTISNRVMTPIGPGGAVDFFNAFGNADIVVDVVGYFTTTGTGSGYFPITPTRICDTRNAGPGVAANGCDTPPQGPLPSGFVEVLGHLNPAVSALVFNVTVTNNPAAGFMTVFPDDLQNVPLAADLTWAPNQTIGNLVVAGLGSTQIIDFFNGSASSTDLVIDVEGFYTATASAASASAGADTPSAQQSLVTQGTTSRAAKHLG